MNRFGWSKNKVNRVKHSEERILFWANHIISVMKAYVSSFTLVLFVVYDFNTVLCDNFRNVFCRPAPVAFLPWHELPDASLRPDALPPADGRVSLVSIL
jgi:hypothetical protein